MYILVFLATLGSLFGWIALANVMAFSDFLYTFVEVMIIILGLTAACSIMSNKNKNGEDSHENTDNML